MAEIVVTGAFKINQGKEEEALEAFTALVAPTHEEKGCILYALHRGTDDPGRLTYIERWESREGLLERSDELWGENGEITVFEAVPAGEPKKGTLRDHAGG
jgi:hypothetical protein